LFEAEGVDAPILSSTTISAQDVAEPRFLLERLELHLDSTMPEHIATTTELLYVEAGTISITDNFGFTSTLTAGSPLSLVAGTEYSLSNDGVETVSLLRASLAPGQDASTGSESIADTDVTASPVASPMATPITEDLTESAVESPISGTSVTLIDLPTDAMPSGEGSFYLAQVSFDPGAESGEQTHSGPVALYIEAGTLIVQSPSGLSGQLQQGQAVILPEAAPLVASNQGNEQAVAYVLGMVEMGKSPMAVVTPAPEPTPTLEPTPEPTATTVPTPTAEPSPTPEPTPTPAPTAVPTPTPIPSTESGTILQLGETWRVEGATMTVSLSDQSSGGAGLTFSYTNLSDSRVDFLPSTGALRVYDDQRNSWEPHENGIEDLLNNRIILEPGETFEHKVHIWQPNGYDPYSSNTFVVVEGFGEIGYAKWGFTYNNGRVLTIPPDAVDPTDGGGSSAPSNDQASGENPPIVSTTAFSGDITSLLPGEADVPEHLVIVGEESRSLDEVAQNYTDPAETVSLFQSLGWQGNVTRAFNMPQGVAQPPGEVEGVYVSIHAFSSPENARAALDFSLTEQMAGTNLSEISISPMGDYSRALYGPVSYGMEITFLVQKGNLLLRLSASSRDSDPTVDGAAAMNAILAKIP
jgi:quercetin dioxygenase-like cupin family protein